MATATSKYVAPNGKEYDTIGIVKIPKINISYPIFSTNDKCRIDESSTL